MSTSGFGECSRKTSPTSRSLSLLYRVFGKRYREVIRGWESSMREGGSNDKRSVVSHLESYFVDTLFPALTGLALP